MIRLRGFVFCFGAAVLGLAALAATTNPWTDADLMAPETLAKQIEENKARMILYVGFPNLYRTGHIPNAVMAGPVGKPEGQAALRAALKDVPRDQEIVLYCGCCPWDVCPNVRPAFQIVKEMGFKRAKLVTIPTNMHTDWVSKGYPFQRPMPPVAK